MTGLLSRRFAVAAVGAVESVIDDAHQHAQRRRVLWGGAVLAALALALILFFTIGNGGSGAGNPSPAQGTAGHQTSGSAAANHVSYRRVFPFGGIRKPPGGAQLKHKHQLLVQPTAVGKAAIWTAPDWAVRGSCAWLTIGQAVYGGECRRSQPPRRGLSEVVPLSLRIRGHTVNLLWGNVGSDVGSLRLRFQDGGVTTLPLTDGVFFHVLPGQRGLVGHRPTRLIARDKSHRTLSKRLRFTIAH
jgi:hypothetical protein